MSLTLWCRRGIRVVACLAVLGFVLAPLADAQSQGTGQIVGTVYDSSGASIPGAKVTVTGKATGLMREVETNADGGYRVVLLPPGPYAVGVKVTGFKAFKSDVTVSVGSAITVDARLQVGQITEVVEVMATAVIETTAVQTDALINQRSITDLPINGRRFQDFVTLTPTVQIEPSRNGISFAGQRGINANITIDGHDYNQPFFGGIRGGERSNQAFSIPQEAISEFQIVPYGYSAEFGRSSSGIMNAVTKSGTNDWHLSAFYFNRHKSMARKDAFNRTVLDTQHQYGGSLGGPLRKDKTFLFGAAEAQKISNPRNVIFRQLETSASFPATSLTPFNQQSFSFYRGLERGFVTTNDAWTVLGRWDEQWSSNHRTGFRYHYSTNTALNAASAGANILPETNDALENNGTEGDNQHTISGQWTGIFSPRVVNEFRAQYSLERRPRIANALLTGTVNTIGTTGTRSFLPTTQRDYRIQISDSLSWSLGKHSVKFGGDFNHVFAEQFFKFNQYGFFGAGVTGRSSMSAPSACQSVSATSPGLVGWLLNLMTPGQNPAFASGTCLDPVHRFDLPLTQSSLSYAVNIGNGLANMSMDTMSLFAQDSWRITPRLTLNFGFRWEGYWNPSPDVSNTALYNMVKSTPFPLLGGRTTDPAKIPDNLKQFMPRIGLAWDPWGNGKTVFRGNAGFYYAQTPLLLFAGPLNNFRTPAGDLLVTLPFTGGTCPAPPPGSPAGLPLTTYCTTLYGQFLLANGVAGPAIDLDTLTLGTLPTLTLAHLTNIGTAMGLTVDPNRGAQPITWANNYEAPRSWQWNIAFEQEIARGFTVGADYVYINTVHLQRNRDFNLPAPFVLATDLSARPCYAVAAGTSPCGTTLVARPTTTANPGSSLGSVQLRDSSSRAFYRGFTMRTAFRRPKFQLQSYFTISKNLSDDDNERDAGGQSAVSAFNLKDEYGLSNLDARYLWVVNSVVQLPWDFQVSGLSRMRSGRPLNPITNVDSNGDTINNDRPYLRPGLQFQRNSFRNRPNYNVDMRVSKRINMPREGTFFNITVDFFNLFDFDNVTFGGVMARYGAGISTAGATVAPNSTFRALRSPSSCLTVINLTGNKGCYDTRNNPGTPFQMQVGVRFQF